DAAGPASTDAPACRAAARRPHRRSRINPPNQRIGASAQERRHYGRSGRKARTQTCSGSLVNGQNDASPRRPTSSITGVPHVLRHERVCAYRCGSVGRSRGCYRRPICSKTPEGSGGQVSAGDLGSRSDRRRGWRLGASRRRAANRRESQLPNSVGCRFRRVSLGAASLVTLFGVTAMEFAARRANGRKKHRRRAQSRRLGLAGLLLALVVLNACGGGSGPHISGGQHTSAASSSMTTTSPSSGTAPTSSTSAPSPSPTTVQAGFSVVHYQSVTFQVPSNWPVYDLAQDPTRCVRYDVHAVYLGHEGSTPNCPA